MEADGVKIEGMKDQIKKEFIRRVRNILNCTEELDRRTRALMIMHGTHHPKADVDRLYLQRCEGGRGLLGLKDCVQVQEHSLGKYLSTLKEKILNEVNRSKIIEIIRAEEVQIKYIKNIEKKYERKPIHGQFRKSIEELRGKRFWDW